MERYRNKEKFLCAGKNGKIWKPREVSSNARKFLSTTKLENFSTLKIKIISNRLGKAASVVAVKRISKGSKQGRKDYVSTVTTISRLRHHNLVKLLGWFHQKGEFLLFNEYLPNGSLYKHYFGMEKKILDWDRQYSISCDKESSLVYLHEEWDQGVVHRDVKASNLMLDSNFNGMLGDLGLARLIERDLAASHSTVVAGTPGYLSPECYIMRKTSPETDVYNFRVVTLEIAYGRWMVSPTLGEHNCRQVEWVWNLYGKGKLLEAADEKLGRNFNGEDMERLMVLGLLCSNVDPTSKPKMGELIKILKREVRLSYVPWDLSVAVYSQHLHREMRSHLSTSVALTSPTLIEPTVLSILLDVKALVLSSSTTENISLLKMSSPLLLMTDLASLHYLMEVGF
ncbi:L-type lectin-domain containing receptor kinase IX.2-like [Cryptomeria japonica]|uniref:L-type lectin-domain containing receptor kinase IX.2-like n=1 Tax=Cryptomeria japonica TaxID=3369 RepID=UPI0025ACA025|nr:L-type lectin-domain containing receptor kinase IX.2-like [Cryptomeria japonica]